jgi:hypothetical protein
VTHNDTFLDVSITRLSAQVRCTQQSLRPPRPPTTLTPPARKNKKLLGTDDYTKKHLLGNFENFIWLRGQKHVKAFWEKVKNLVQKCFWGRGQKKYIKILFGKF